jgi:hypothetical protein
MNREMSRLISEWNTRLEIDTRDNDYQQQRIRAQELQQARTPTALVPAFAPIDVRRLSETPAGDERMQSQSETLTIEQVGAAALKFDWKEMEIRFRESQANATEQRFPANFIRTDWESGEVSKEWIVGGNPAFREEFENLASISARKLGCTRSEGANEYWLDRVWEWMQQAGLDKDKNVAWLPTGTVVQAGLTGTTQGLYTEKIAELSAQFCLELMTRGTPESAVPPHVERSATGGSTAATDGGDKEGHESQQNLIPGNTIQPEVTTPKVSNGRGEATRKSLLKQIQNAPDGESFKTALAARALNVNPRTIQRRVKNGKLVVGAKRGTITAASLRRLLNLKRPSSAPQHRTRI